MKRIFSLIGFLPIMTIGQNKGNAFILKGKIQNFTSNVDWVFLEYSKNGEFKTDSSHPKNSRYQFFGNIDEPVEARLKVKFIDIESGQDRPINYMKDVIAVFLEPGKIKVISIDSFKNVQVKGSISHNEFVKLNKQVSPFGMKFNVLMTKSNEYKKAKDQQNLLKVEAKLDTLEKEMNENVYREYVIKNPSSPLAMYALLEYAGAVINPEKVEPLFNSLSAANRSYPSALEFKERLEATKKTGIGKLAMDFIQNDTLGNPVTLSSFKGRYVLIEFWASWCGPCRAENPNLVKVFNDYKDKNFHIIGVSLDRPGQKEKWLKAIHDDGLEWTQVSDLMFWDNAVAKQYGIRAIPQSLLLDPEGKIIAKNLSSDELAQKLSKVIEVKKQY